MLSYGFAHTRFLSSHHPMCVSEPFYFFSSLSKFSVFPGVLKYSETCLVDILLCTGRHLANNLTCNLSVLVLKSTFNYIVGDFFSPILFLFGFFVILRIFLIFLTYFCMFCSFLPFRRFLPL